MGAYFVRLTPTVMQMGSATAVAAVAADQQKSSKSAKKAAAFATSASDAFKLQGMLDLDRSVLNITTGRSDQSSHVCKADTLLGDEAAVFDLVKISCALLGSANLDDKLGEQVRRLHRSLAYFGFRLIQREVFTHFSRLCFLSSPGCAKPWIPFAPHFAFIVVGLHDRARSSAHR
jgi:hypothetical protein